MVLVIFLPEADAQLALPRGEGVIVHDDKLLVGGGIQEESIALAGQNLAELDGHGDGVTADLKIEIVLKQDIELNAEQTSLGQQCAVLLDLRDKASGGIVCI